MSWQDDKAKSDKYVPTIIMLIAPHLIKPAPLEDDREKNTDLIVLEAGTQRIACRLRNVVPYYEKYGHQFTIRSGRPSGAKTELAKIIEGWGDYFFYGFMGEEPDVPHWILGDLKVFRLWFMRQLARTKEMPGQELFNGDGSSTFRAFNWADIDGFIVAQSEVAVPF